MPNLHNPKSYPVTAGHDYTAMNMAAEPDTSGMEPIPVYPSNLYPVCEDMGVDDTWRAFTSTYLGVVSKRYAWNNATTTSFVILGVNDLVEFQI